MRRRIIALIVAGVVIAAALVVGVVRAGAQGPTSLPSITVSQLLQNIATQMRGTTAISGDVAWTNSLLGSTSLLSLGGNQTPAGLSSLLTGGSGRIWAQGGKVRLESQGQNGDFVVVAGATTVWTWDSMTATATQYALPARSGAMAPASPLPQTSIDPAVAIERLIQKLAPQATLGIGGQATVAGRKAYTLTLTPTSPVTTLGSVAVAIDGHRWVPLRVQVFAKGGGGAVLSAGFKTVSFAPLSAGLFTFTPPGGATIVHKNVGAGLGSKAERAGAAADKGGAIGTGAADGKSGARHSPLTLAQAESQAPFLLTPAVTPTGIEFRGAFVTPAKALAAQAPGGGLTAGQRRALAILAKHPAAVLDYGSGFGTVLLIEAKISAAQDAQLQQQLGRVATIGKTTVNGLPATKLQTSLGSAVTFRQGDVRVVVAGLVPWGDVMQIAGSLR